MLNLTQHQATPEQMAAGVVEPEDKAAVQELLTFQNIPNSFKLESRAWELAKLAKGHESAMIGGAPYLMAPLEKALRKVGVIPFYSFSRRESVEEFQADGTVIKRTAFRHVGFVCPETMSRWTGFSDAANSRRKNHGTQ